MLQIAIHGNQIFTGGMIEPGGQGRGLSEVAAQLHHDHTAVDRGDILQRLEGAIAAAVIHENQLKVFTGGFHDGLQPVVKLGAVLFLVVKWDNNRVFDHDL